jgi:type I restriction enzyme M protein
MINFQEKVNFIWSNAEILRGTYKKEQYGNIILPMSILTKPGITQIICYL